LGALGSAGRYAVDSGPRGPAAGLSRPPPRGPRATRSAVGLLRLTRRGALSVVNGTAGRSTRGPPGDGADGPEGDASSISSKCRMSSTPLRLPLGLVRSPTALLTLVRLGAFGRLGAAVRRRFRDPRLHRLFSLQVMYAGLAPDAAGSVRSDHLHGQHRRCLVFSGCLSTDSDVRPDVVAGHILKVNAKAECASCSTVSR
jgi:hypothetical protein